MSVTYIYNHKRQVKDGTRRDSSDSKNIQFWRYNLNNLQQQSRCGQLKNEKTKYEPINDIVCRRICADVENNINDKPRIKDDLKDGDNCRNKMNANAP